MADTRASFIENINILANATKAAAGDIIEDAELAKNDAEKAAVEAVSAAADAENSKDIAREWAEKSFNSEITGNPGHYSSFHWSEIAKQNSGDTIIIDSVVSTSKTWSSQKINDELLTKSDTAHRHDSDYMPKVIEGTAYNKNFTDTSNTESGTSTYVARGDHNHDSLYEPKRHTQGTAYNKNFGTASGEVAEGDHTHPDLMSTTSWTASGKISTAVLPWVADVLNPQSNEIPRGDHIHKAENISYEPLPQEDYPVITSTTVQGALAQLDRKYSILDVAEKNFITAGLSVTHEVPIAGIDTPVDINAPLAVAGASNASITNGSQFKIEYPSTDIPKKKIEGVYSITIVLNDIMVEDIALSVAVDGITMGEHSSGTSRTLTFSKHLVGLSETGFTISPMVTNRTNTNNVFIDSINAMWVGAPEGALVASGLSVDHTDLTGTGAPNGVHTVSDIQDLQLNLDAKAGKVSDAVEGNLASLDAYGNLVDSGIPSTDSQKRMDKIDPAVLDNIIVQTSTGNAKDGGIKIADLALKDGSITQPFSVGSATTSEHAIRKDTFDNTVETLSTKAELSAHTVLANPHNTTPSDIGAAQVEHQHAQSDITGLTDALDSRYEELIGATQNNIMAFGIGNKVIDTGKNISDFEITSMAAGNINNPLLDLPLNNNLVMKQGAGSVTFTRASTATYIDRYGVLQTAAVDEPRFEKDGLLIEGDSTNVITNSEDFSGWVYLNSTTAISTTEKCPNGVDFATELNDTTTDVTDRINVQSNLISVEPGDIYTASIFVKREAADHCYIIFQGGYSESWSAALYNFDINTWGYIAGGTIQESLKAEELPNGWFRLSISCAMDISDSIRVSFGVYGTYTSSNSTAMYLFGAQAEKLSLMTSYIPTEDVAVTRAKDIALVQRKDNAPSIYDEYAFSVDYVPLSPLPFSTHRFPLSLSLGGDFEYYSMLRINSGEALLRFYGIAGGLGPIPLRDKVSRILVTYDGVSSYSIYDNGTHYYTQLDYQPNNSGIQSNIGIGCTEYGENQLYGHVKNVRIWDKYITKEEARLA